MNDLPDGAAPPRLWLGETVAAVLAALAGLLCLPVPQAVAGAVLAGLAAWVAAVDRRRWLIPDGAVVAMATLGIGLAVTAAAPAERLDAALDALTRAAAAGLFFWLLRALHGLWRGGEGLGFGDVGLAAAGATWLDWDALVPALEVAVGGALVVVAVAALRARRRPRGDEALPFGVFLAPAIWAAWFASQTGLLARALDLLAV